jgi:hypothetical protein
MELLDVEVVLGGKFGKGLMENTLGRNEEMKK